ncbi:MAG: penicillin-binding transpeptidase domain-containing protein [Longibaculum sp.]
MYDVYTNNNHKKKYIIIAIVAVAVIAVVVAGFFLLGGDNKEKVLKDYYSKVAKKDYEGMYALIDETSQKKYTKDVFTTRNQNIYEGIGANQIEVSVDSKDGDELQYTVKMQSTAGEISFQNKTTFHDGKIAWNDSFIFPELKENYKVRITDEKASRGKILDRNGKVLAGKGEAYSVGLVRGKLNGENDYEKLANLLGLTKEGIQKTMSASWIKDDSFVPLKTISKSDTNLENSLLKIPGVKLSTTSVRYYPYGKVTSHLIGYMQKVTAEDLEKHKGEGYSETSYIGRSGIEAAYEKELKGKDGVSIYIVDENGERITSLASQEKADGQDIALTIDVNLQKNLFNAFANDKSASVAMNPTNGEVLALVSTPTFDSNDFILGMSSEKWDTLNNDKAQPLYNRFKGTVVPGSSMKPLTAAIGLNTKSLDATKDFQAEMKWQKDSSWGSYYVTTLHAPTPNHLKNALIYSDNVYFAKAALEIGKDNLIKGYQAMKIGEEIPFELSLHKSQYTSKDFSDEIQIADSGYGQGQILLNPVQMASIYGAFVNDGKMMKPHVVLSTKTAVWSEAFSKDVANEIKNDLVGVISDAHGTAHSFYHNGMTLAGKTGTGEVKASQDDATGTEVGWFNVMTTDSQKPIVISTMVEDVKGRGGSGYVVNQLKQPFDEYMK